MFQFHGKSPAKQGGKYGLNLGQNEGPYLPKDIMARQNRQSFDFQKTSPSMAKSTAQSILATTYSSTGRKKGGSPPRNVPVMLSKISEERSRPVLNYDEIKNSGLSTAENIISTVNFENAMVRETHKSLDEYKKSITEYKNDLKEVQANILGKPFDELRAIQTQMRKMYTTMKDFSEFNQNENYQLQRDIDQLNRDKHNLIQQLGFYENRLFDLEKTIGAAAKLNDEDDSFVESEIEV